MSIGVKFEHFLEIRVSDGHGDWKLANRKDMKRILSVIRSGEQTDEIIYLKTTDAGRKKVTQLVEKGLKNLDRHEQLDLLILLKGLAVEENIQQQVREAFKGTECQPA